jgi:hypothetical protein
MKKKLTDAMTAKAKQYAASQYAGGKGGGKKKMTVSDLMGDCKK